jgi:hypothetical protein
MPNSIERIDGKGAAVVDSLAEQQIIVAQLMPLMPAIETARECREQCDELPRLAGCYVEMVPRAFANRAEMLPDKPKVEKAEAALRTALLEKIAPSAARAMLIHLFKSGGRKPGENAESLLAACIAMFGEGEQIGAAIGLWKAIPNQPCVLALAVERLIRTSTFQPVPCELRKACRLAYEKLENKWRAAAGWLAELQEAEDVLRKFAPAQIEPAKRAAACRTRADAKRSTRNGKER